MDTDQNPCAEHKKTDPPSSATAYLDPKYWNQRFSNEEHYEWFKDYSHFRHLIQANIKPSSSSSWSKIAAWLVVDSNFLTWDYRLLDGKLCIEDYMVQVLELGCGNSQLCEELYKDGISEITCIDLSSVAVERMKERLLSKGYKEIKVLEADMLDLPFSNECFDVVIEKGTMDVLFVDSGDPWNPQPATVSKVMAMLEGVHKVLKPNGIFISITFGQVSRESTAFCNLLVLSMHAKALCGMLANGGYPSHGVK
ncbi:hypothetical protein COLO4_32471 [Corchorus olitorius]|uniref:Methyltransferase domain-containing protein n=1 Tax=Corchorus olitorius TaxID=93759 RepID=A0A1R3GZ84_9ROSI|nr:hypothetical protein COLO4_32471 [Corchorus olitorius]